MAGVISLLTALTISLIVNRIAAMALMFTGLSRESARFQARSAFSGVGFATQEAEAIVNHPVRRRIIMVLMLLGNIGIATVIAATMVSVSSAVGASFHDQLLILIMLLIGLVVLWFTFSSRWVERWMNKLIAWSLKRFTDLDVRDYVSLLKLDGGYSVSELNIEPKHWLSGGSLRDLRLSEEGILVLGIRRADGAFTGIPQAGDTIQPGDSLILYGDIEKVRMLDRRTGGPSGDKEHAAAVLRQQQPASQGDDYDE